MTDLLHERIAPPAALRCVAHPDFWQRQQELIALIKDLRMFSPASLPLIELGEDALIETSRYRDRMQRIEAKVQALKAPCVCSR